MSDMAISHVELIQRLGAKIHATLDPMLKDAPHLALLDFPEHWNVGDSAIWLGEIAYLRKVCGRDPDYTCSATTYDPLALRERAPDGPILISGGGNFGDLYLLHQNLRERVCADFPDRPVIQLPQSIHFQTQERFDQARTIFGAHPRFTLLTRDKTSHAIAGTFDCAAALIPDMALCLGALDDVIRRPAHDLVALLRRDREIKIDQALQTMLAPSVRALDWQQEDSATLLVLERYITAREGGTQARTALAQHRLARGLEILASGKHVATDRLHGHILSLLLGVPHFVFDNSYNKNGAFFETWISGYANATFGDSIGAFVAWAEARGLGGLVAAAARDTVGTVVA